MPETSTATRPKSPSINLLGPAAQESLAFSASATSYMSPLGHTSTKERLNSSSIISFDPSAQGNCEFKTSTTSDMPAQPESDSEKEPSTTSNWFADDSSNSSSSGGTDNSPGAKSQSSSIDSLDKLPQDDSESDEDDPPTGSQHIAAYASPLRDGQRIRTSCDSIYDTGQWHVDPDGFINEKYRVGGPFLCSLPVTILDLKGSSQLWTVFENPRVYRIILSDLDEFKINVSSIKIKMCQYRFYPILRPMATLIITATRDKFSDVWVQACRQIWNHLSENGLGHINVEISDSIIHNQFHFWPVESETPYYPVHLDLMERMRKEIDLTDWLSLGAYRMGTTSDIKDSEVFMLLDVDFKSKRDWRGPREQMVSILEEFGLPMVGVIIQKGKMWGARWGCESPKREGKSEKSPEPPDVVARMTW
ncbi:unnamed protein product [Penicillium glandicola]